MDTQTPKSPEQPPDTRPIETRLAELERRVAELEARLRADDAKWLGPDGAPLPHGVGG